MENDSENSSLCGFEEPREEDQSLHGYMELSQDEADVRKTLLECIDKIQVTGKFATGYNLVGDYKCPSASMVHSQSESLVKALSLWEYMHNPPKFLIYPLNNQYTTTNLRLSSLEGPDYYRVHCLNDSCIQHGRFYLFLAHLNSRNTWPNDEDEDDELDIYCQKYLHNVCSLEGFKLSTQKVNADKVLPLKPISCKRDPDTRVGRQYLGSQGGRIESNAVLLIVQTDFLHAPLFNPRDPQEVDRAMTHLRAGIDDNNKATVQKIIFCLCRIILNEVFAAEEANDKCLGYVAATAACLDNRSLVKEACKKTLMTSEWDENTWVTLGTLIDPLKYPETQTIFRSLTKYGTFCVIYRGLTNFYKGLYKNNSQKKPRKAEYWKQWYSDKLTKTLNLCDALEDPEAVDVIDEIVLDPEIQYTTEQRTKIDEAVTGLIDRFKDAKDFVFALNVNLLRHLTLKDAWRKEVIHDLFNVILESAISTFNFESYYNLEILHIFYREALAHDKGSAFKLLQQILKNACRTDKSTALGILMLLIRELLSLDDTNSIEAQSQLLLKAYITKAAGVKPSKPEGWARPTEARICSLECKACDELTFFLNDSKEEEITIALTAVQQIHVQEIYMFLKIGNGDREGEVRLTKTSEKWDKSYRNWNSRAKAARDDLKKEFGDKYNRLTGSTAQATNKAQLPLQPKRKRGEDTDNARARTSKRAQGEAANKAQLPLRPKRKRGEDTDNARARTSKRARGDGEKNESG